MRTNTVSLEFVAGTHIDDAAKHLCELATKNFTVATGDFNGKEIRAWPFSSPNNIIKNYRAFCYHESERYQKSPEGIAAKEKWEAERQAALSAPPKMFPVRTVLSLTTKRLLTKPINNHDNGIDDLYQIVNHALATSVSTLGLIRTSEFLTPKILELYPELSIADDTLPILDGLLEAYGPEIAINSWITSLGLAEEYSIPVFQKD